VPSFRTGAVTAVTLERPGLQKVEVDGEPSYVLVGLIGPVAVGDRVVINTTAVELGLGTGGRHFVHWNLSRDEWSAPGGGHVMKLRYTSLQADTGVAEEHVTAAVPAGPPRDLGGLPVVVCALHSQVPCVAAAFADRAPGRRLVYVMTDTAALPLALSDVVFSMRGAGLLVATVTAGQAFGGDHEAVNVWSALQVAAGVGGAEAVVVAPGPGVVGTGTDLGFGGLEVAGVCDAAATLGAVPVVCVRYSEADERERHRGVSRHTKVALEMRNRPVLVAVPAEGSPDVHPVPEVRVVEVPDMAALFAHHNLDVTSMGRTLVDDPEFFRWAAAAGVLAAELIAPGHGP